MCFALFLVGLYGVITRRNLVKIAISLSITHLNISMPRNVATMPNTTLAVMYTSTMVY